MTQHSSTRAYVIFQVAENRFALDCESVAELLTGIEDQISGATAIGRDMVGIFNHRGTVLPVFDFRRALGKQTFAERYQEMTEFIQAREQDHISWLEDLRRSAETGAKFTKATDPTLCNFGKWYESVKNSPEELQRLTMGSVAIAHLFEAFDQPHRRIHGIANRVLELTADKCLDEAFRLIQQTWDNELSMMKELFKTFLLQYRRTLRSTAIILHGEGRSAALLVDSIHCVQNCSSENFELLPTLGTNEAHEVAEFGTYVNGVLCMKLDAEAILDLCGLNAAA
jgi:purine-binding chemotaxis protein CheW